MAVFNGQRADQVTFNNAFLSRTQDSDTVAIVGLNHPSSGGLIANAQLQINTNKDNIASNDTDILNLQLEKEDKINKGAPLGYVPLNAATKIDNIYLDDRVVTIEGNWDAATNTPTLVDGVGNTGEVYVVNVAGTQDLGSGPKTFELGDWAVYRAIGVWQRVQNSTAVASVNGQTGAVVLNLDDINDVDIPSPGAGDDQKAVIWDNATSSFKLGSPVGTGGSGGINYVINTGAELNADDHTAYKDAALSSPEDGIGGSPTLTVTRSIIAGDILNGDGTFVISKPASNVQGEGIHVGLDPIDPRYKNERLQVSFEMKNPNPGSNLYADDDFRVFVYDVDNATLIGAIENDDNGFIKRHAGDGVTILGFFNATNSLNYRLLIHCVTTSTDASVIAYDNVKLGPITFVQAYAKNTIEQKVLSSNVTINTTMGDLTFTALEIGAEYELTGTARMRLDSGANDDAVSISIFNGVTKIGEILSQLGDPDSTASSNNYAFIRKFIATDSIVTFVTADTSVNSYIEGNGTTNLTYFQLEKRNDLKTNTISNTQLTFEAAKLKVTRSSIVATAGVETKVTGLTPDIDTHSLWDSINNKAVIKVNGIYTINGLFTSETFDGDVKLKYKVNGGAAQILARASGTGSEGLPDTRMGFDLKTLSANDEVEFFVESGGVSRDTYNFILSIKREPNFTSYGVVNPNTDYLSTSSGALTAWPVASTQYGDLTSLSLEPGEWEIHSNVIYRNDSATPLGITDILSGISTTPGNSFPDLVFGDNCDACVTSNTAFESRTLFSRKVVTIGVTTTFYLKIRSDIVNANLKTRGYKLTARRFK